MRGQSSWWNLNFHHSNSTLEKMEWKTTSNTNPWCGMVGTIFGRCDPIFWRSMQETISWTFVFDKRTRQCTYFNQRKERVWGEVNKIKDLNTKVVFEKWIKFKEFIILEKEDTIRNSQGCQHITTMVERSITKQVVKQPRNKETKAKRKEKVLVSGSCVL